MPKDVENCESFNTEEEHVLEVSNDESLIRNDVDLYDANEDSGFNVNDNDSAVEAVVCHDAVDNIADVDARSEDAAIRRHDGSLNLEQEVTKNVARVQVTPQFIGQYPLPRLDFWKIVHQIKCTL